MPSHVAEQAIQQFKKSMRVVCPGLQCAVGFAEKRESRPAKTSGVFMAEQGNFSNL